MANLFDIPWTAKRLHTSERHVRELIYRKELPYFKVGRLVRFDSDDIDAWLQANRVEQRRDAA